MSLLRSLSHLFQPIREVTELPAEVAKGINRSTPWGQAHQQEASLQRPVVRSPLTFGTNSNQVAQTYDDTTPLPNIQGEFNAGYTPLQSAGNQPQSSAYYGNTVQTPRPYDQQQLQVGVTLNDLSYLTAPKLPFHPLAQTYQTLPEIKRYR